MTRDLAPTDPDQEAQAAEKEPLLTEIPESERFRPGEIYEDCAYHPVLCVEVDYEEDSIRGISLIDGTYPRDCSLLHCGVRKLTVPEAWDIRINGPLPVEVRSDIEEERRWWTT